MFRNAVRAVDRHHVRMTHLRQHPSFVNHDRRVASVPPVASAQQLQRHLTIQSRVPRSIDRAERTLADFLQHAERTPGLQRHLARIDVSGVLLVPAVDISSSRADRVVARGARLCSVDVGDRGDHFQFADDSPNRLGIGT
jgi:hypothetical protein